MVWVKIDDKFDDDPDIDAVGVAGIALFICACTWSARNETDGELTHERLRKLPGWSQRTVNELIRARWFERSDDGIVIRSFLKYNPSKAQNELARIENNKRKRKQREHESHLNGYHNTEMSQRDTIRDSQREY